MQPIVAFAQTPSGEVKVTRSPLESFHLAIEPDDCAIAPGTEPPTLECEQQEWEHGVTSL